MSGVTDLLMCLVEIFCLYVVAFYRLFVPPQRRNVSGQVVVVTGGGQGIGREIALEFARVGAKVVIWDYDKTAADTTASDINNTSGEAKAYKCDVTDVEAVKKVAQQTVNEVGEVDILVNNAGILICKDLCSLTEAEIRKTMEVNTMAHFWTVKAFLPSMMERKCGHIITIASMAAKGGSPNMVDYCASKYAVNGFTESLYYEMKAKGLPEIRTTTVYPMFVGTQLVKNVEDRMKVQTGVTKLLKVEDVGKAVVDGALRGQRYVYCPSSLSFSDTLGGILPVGAQDVLMKYAPAGFASKNEM